MQCPIDKTDLVMAERSGIEIDYCPKCRGVWLDRGELDKIIERAAAQPAPQPAGEYRPEREYRGEREYRHEHRDRPYHKKRKSFLDDIFDF
jgi:Zn-finger nucleic acid-binding protein